MCISRLKHLNRWKIRLVPWMRSSLVTEEKKVLSTYRSCAIQKVSAQHCRVWDFNHFDLFQSISIYSNLFQSIPIYSNLFQSIPIFSIYFSHFNLFWFILIPTSESPKHFNHVLAISIVSSCHSKNGAWWRLLPPHFCLFHSHYAGI
jgi:hypothetical protein